jgi:hypothetical protein
MEARTALDPEQRLTLADRLPRDQSPVGQLGQVRQVDACHAEW